MTDLDKTQEQINEQYLDDQDLSKTKVSLIEERLNVGIRQVETGKVQLNKKVISEEVIQEVPVIQEEIQVERKAINEYVATAPGIRYDGDTTIISVVKEVLVVEKRLMLVEELHITKKQVTTNSIVKEVLRREEIEINRTDSQPNNLTTNQ